MHSGMGSPSADSVPPSSSQTVKNTISPDANLSQLREQVKKVMIPLLIKIFELKLAAQQAKSPSSRLNKQSQESPKEIREQLLNLEEDIKLLHLWCQSCQKQIEKALNETEKVGETSLRNAASEKISHPAIEKSFSEAVSMQAALFKSQQRAKESSSNAQAKESSSKSNWLRKFLDR